MRDRQRKCVKVSCRLATENSKKQLHGNTKEEKSVAMQRRMLKKRCQSAIVKTQKA